MPLPSSTRSHDDHPIEQAEAFVGETGATIHHGGNRAFCRLSTDSIQLPPHEAFIGSDDLAGPIQRRFDVAR
jgi:antirestriction protein ArdC